jgi:hypothetical protein
MDTNYPLLRDAPQSFGDALVRALRDPERITGQGGAEGGKGRVLSGGGGLNMVIPVGENGTIVTDLGGGGFRGEGRGKFFPQGAIGYKHEWNF